MPDRLAVELYASRPYAWWRFNGPTAALAAVDSSGNGRSVSFTGSPTYGAPVGLDGRRGVTLPSGSYATLASFPYSYTGFTIWAVCRIDTAAGSPFINTVAGYENNFAAIDWGLRLSSMKPEFYIRNNSATYYVNTALSAVVVGVPFTIAGRVNGIADIALVVNGAIAATTTSGTGTWGSTQTLQIGRDQFTASRPLAGGVSELAVWQRAIPFGQLQRFDRLARRQLAVA